MRPVLTFWLAVLACAGAPAQAAELRGHGGTVRALAVGPAGAALTGSFDNRAILWNLAEGTAARVLLHHEASVNAVAFLPGGRLATAGQAGDIALWDDRAEPARVFAAHQGPVVALAVSPDGKALASAAWDGSARITMLEDGAQTVLSGHEGNVNGVAWLGRERLATVGYDGTLRFWSAAGVAGPVVRLPVQLNALAVDGAGRLWAAGADGALRGFSENGAALAEISAGAAPLISLAVSPDGASLAAGSVDGRIVLVGPDAGVAGHIETGAPVWALAFDPSGSELLAGGPDNVVRAWDAATGAALSAPPGPAIAGVLDGSRGAQVFRACAVCHSLDPDDGARAGPTLHEIFGRRIASVEGYDYSPALRDMTIVWTPQTVAALFERGPSRYTPGTKMPEQTIGSAEDRAALIDFLERATR